MEAMEAPALVVRADEFPWGVRCGECDRELSDGERYARRLTSFLGDAPVSVIVCVPCGLGATP